MKVSFGEALFIMRSGGKVRRKSWPATWDYMRLEDKTGTFLISHSGSETELPWFPPAMILAEDWRELE